MNVNLLARIAGNKMQDAKAIPSTPGPMAGIELDRSCVLIDFRQIVPDPTQPRKDMGDLSGLVASIKESGIQQPIVVRWHDGVHRWIIIAGERRFRAAEQLGLDKIPCKIHHGELSADELLKAQLLENLMREDLKPIEKAESYKRLLNKKGWTLEKLSQFLHVSESSISQALAVLEKIPEQYHVPINRGELPVSTAYELSKIKDQEQQRQAIEASLAAKLTRSDVKKLRKKRKRKTGIGGHRSKFCETECGGRVTVSFKKRTVEEEFATAAEEAAEQFRAEAAARSQDASAPAA